MKIIGHVVEAIIVASGKPERYAYINGLWYNVAPRPIANVAQVALDILDKDMLERMKEKP